MKEVNTILLAMILFVNKGKELWLPTIHHIPAQSNRVKEKVRAVQCKHEFMFGGMLLRVDSIRTHTNGNSKRKRNILFRDKATHTWI